MGRGSLWFSSSLGARDNMPSPKMPELYFRSIAGMANNCPVASEVGNDGFSI